MEARRALITGITGQDGYFMALLLLSKGYEVHGMARRRSDGSLGTLEEMPADKRDAIHLHFCDVTDAACVERVVREVRPDELYHFAAQSFVPYSFENPRYTYDVNISGTLNVVNAVRDYSRHTRLYNAATSEMYGLPDRVPQNEETPFRPRSPYAVSKLAAFWTVKTYREAYGLFMSNGIAFNHESEVRGPEFVTRKVSIGVARYVCLGEHPILLGNLDARKDWGYAGDFVEAMWLMLQHDRPDDFVIGTGEQHTVREFATEAFAAAGIKVRWEGSGLSEVAVDEETGKVVVRVDPSLFRPLEAENYMADYSKIYRTLGWRPKTTFRELARRMVEADIRRLRERGCADGGPAPERRRAHVQREGQREGAVRGAREGAGGLQLRADIRRRRQPRRDC